jgi:hypothetical protein
MREHGLHPKPGVASPYICTESSCDIYKYITRVDRHREVGWWRGFYRAELGFGPGWTEVIFGIRALATRRASIQSGADFIGRS